MPTTAGDIYIRSGNSGAFTAVEYVQGAWITVDSGSDMTSLDESRLIDGQVIYVRSEDKTYLTSRFVAFETPGYSGFTNSASFAEFNFPSSGGGSTDTGSLLTTGSVSGNILTFTKGDGNTFNLTVDTGSGGGGSGDITAVIAGDGLSGGASTGDATLTLDSGSTHFINAVLGSGLFRLTGSVYATTNDIAITGSLDVNFVESDQEFRVYSQSSIQFSINNEGVAVLAPRSTAPTAVSGGMYFSTDGNFYFGIQQ